MRRGRRRAGPRRAAAPGSRPSPAPPCAGRSGHRARRRSGARAPARGHVGRPPTIRPTDLRRGGRSAVASRTGGPSPRPRSTRRPARRRPSTTISGPPCSIALTIRLSTACSRAAASPSTTASPARQRSSSEPPPSATLACQRRTAERSGASQRSGSRGRSAAAAVDLPIEALEGDRRQPRRARDDVATRSRRREGKRLQRAAQLVQRLVDRGPLALRHPSISRYPTPQQLIT